MQNSVCVHAHFYQPPRENPWTGQIEAQSSAAPFHDWNERIAAECYTPFASARRLLPDGTEVTENLYERVSFNFGPTLLSWMEAHVPETYRKIQEADRSSRQRLGHGNALAQVYNHMILPLANRRDKVTQVRWGLRDFEHRFGRPAEGMWLAETAADTATLEVLAEEGIRFTVLAPRQAWRIRKITGTNWREVHDRIDPTRPYLCQLPSGRSIVLFFYDGPISQAIAFEKLLDNGDHFADRLASGFHPSRRWRQLVHIATDGETYRHHHKFGEMALAAALRNIEERKLATLTNYGAYLAANPPTHEVEIAENTSWSCVHGVERWRSDCGCNSGRAGWNQRWRAPLRSGLDTLRDRLAELHDQEGRRYFQDPWAARNDYIQVLLDPAPDSTARFLEMHRVRPLSAEETAAALSLMEIQRNSMLMYTSCGWFFDEVSGLETVQVIQYAARAVQLARDVLQTDLEREFLGWLRRAKSNLPEYQDGEQIYNLWIKKLAVTRRRLFPRHPRLQPDEQRAA
jgi:alpha-amylase/alpha-mannosidase (GH57 family)